MEDFNVEVHSIGCPNCRKTIFIPAVSGTQSIACSVCLTDFPASFWSLFDKEVLPLQKSGHVYNLRVRADSVECVGFTSKFPDLSLMTGDRLLLVGKLNRPVFIKNLTADWTHFSSFPSQVLRLNHALLIILFAVLGYIYLGFYIFGIMPVFLSLFWLKNKFFESKAKQISDRQTKILCEQQKKFAVLYELRLKYQKNESKYQNILELQSKLSLLLDNCAEMQFSADHLEVLGRGLKQVGIHHEALGSMLKSYKRLINLLWMDIELEKTTDLLPSSTLFDYLQEAEQIEEKLQFQLVNTASMDQLYLLGSLNA